MKKFLKLKYFWAFCFVIVIILTLIMTLKSPINSHPDEYEHFGSGEYYFDNWVFPEIGDPETNDAYSIYGVSRINHLGIEYLFAGKVALIFRPFLDDLVALRLFNFVQILILSGLAVYFFLRNKKISIIFLPILISPQIWYIFSYLNDDGFPLFLAFLILVLLLYNESPIYRYLKSKRFKLKDSWGLMILGILLGIIFISKSNYIVTVFFFVLYFLWRLYFAKARELFLKKLLIIGLFFILSIGVRYAIDFSINGFDRDEKIESVKEEKAAYEFKPSTVEENPEATIDTMMLKAKGKSLWYIFKEKGWLQITAASFFGAYGYVDIIASKWIYGVFILSFAIWLGIIYYSVWKTKNRKMYMLALIPIAVFLFNLVASLYYSWIIDLQPQGRYFFPTLPALALLLWHIQSKIYFKRAFNIVLIILILLGFYSFIFIGLAQIL